MTSVNSVALMQPYLLPYIGYWQLLASADRFVLYDTVQYSSGGWINRNRMLVNGTPRWFTVPVRRTGLSTTIAEARLTADVDHYRERIRHQFAENYRRSPYRDDGMAVLDAALDYRGDSLLDLLVTSIAAVQRHLAITTPIVLASDLSVSANLPRVERVIALVRAAGGNEYLSLSGATTLYSPERFAHDGLDLRFRIPRDDEMGTHPWAMSIMHALFTTHPAELHERVLSARWTDPTVLPH